MFNNTKKEIMNCHHERTKESCLLKFFVAIAFFVFLCMGVVNVEAASKRKDVREGNALYAQGAYADSIEKYTEALSKDPESDIINFDIGTAFYKDEDYEKAIEYLQKVLLSEDNQLKEKAYYNLGNALYKSGLSREEDDIQEAVSSLEQSLNQYEQALTFNQENENTKYNYDFVKKELVRLKEEQQQQQNQEGESKEREEKEGEDQQQRQQGQDQQQQQKQEGEKEGQEGEQKSQEEAQQQESKQGEKEGKQQGQEKDEKAQKQDAKGEGDEYNKQDDVEEKVVDEKELTKKEAEMLLKDYQQSEEPQGLLKFLRGKSDTRPVSKDW